MNNKFIKLFLIALSLTSNAIPVISHWTPLHQAAEDGNTNRLIKLLQNNANVNAQDFNDWTPLHSAAYWGQTECIEILLQHGAKINIKNSVGKTPLHLAILNGHTQCVKILLEHDANLEMITSDNKTSKCLAQEYQRSSIVTLIECYESILEIKEPYIE